MLDDEMARIWESRITCLQEACDSRVFYVTSRTYLTPFLTAESDAIRLQIYECELCHSAYVMFNGRLHASSEFGDD